jgi:hypothetical protein
MEIKMNETKVIKITNPRFPLRIIVGQKTTRGCGIFQLFG